MREIVFRGKRTDNGEWVEGWYIHTKRHHCIITGCIDDGYVVYGHYASDVAMYVVNPATVGQYTGLKDKNGRRIFEGDIVEFVDMLDFEYKAVPFKVKGTMCFCDGRYVICGNITHYRLMDFEMSVIGNIHDNGELMEVR